MRLRFRPFRPIWSKSRFLKSQSKKNDDWFRFARIDNDHQTLQKWKTTNEVEISFHSLFVFIIAEKKEKKRLSSSFSSFNKQLPFILTHSISSNQSNQSQSNHDENEKRKRWKWTSSTTIEQIETPSFNARVKRGWKQTTLPQLPAFPAFCKCNEHPITSNAHWYPSGHSCRPRSVPLMF